ncbi:MAG: YeeE/YedE family protein [Pseudomonadota bacterium]
MVDFTPVPAAIGGLLIGFAALLLVLLNGRVAGISGIVGGILRAPHEDRSWRLAFVLGLILAPLAYVLAGSTIAPVTVTGSPAILALGGLLVGFGTRLSNGCTSGHGVCGIARFSLRGIEATVIFMLAAAVTVFLTRHLLGG